MRIEGKEDFFSNYELSCIQSRPQTNELDSSRESQIVYNADIHNPTILVNNVHPSTTGAVVIENEEDNKTPEEEEASKKPNERQYNCTWTFFKGRVVFTLVELFSLLLNLIISIWIIYSTIVLFYLNKYTVESKK